MPESESWYIPLMTPMAWILAIAILASIDFVGHLGTIGSIDLDLMENLHMSMIASQER
jgi:hypothetical protein